MKHNNKRKKALKAAGVTLGAAALFAGGGLTALTQALNQNKGDNAAEVQLEAQLDSALTASGATASSGTSVITSGLPNTNLGGTLKSGARYATEKAKLEVMAALKATED